MTENKITNKVKKLKNLEIASMWCAIASLLIFFGNLIAFVAILIIGSKSGNDFNWATSIRVLTLITENISLACIAGWIIIAIIEMIMIGRNEELKKYHKGSFAAWIIAMILSLGFLFLSLLIFIVYGNEWTIYVTFILYIAATSGSVIYLTSICRSLNKIRNDSKAINPKNKD